MQYERVVSLSSGTCIKIDNSLKTSVKSITFELENNKKYEDHISIYNEREVNIEGIAYVDTNRITIKNPYINGKAFDIVYSINTADMEDGDVINGNLSIVSNVGVKDIPFEYKIITTNTKRAIAKFEVITDFYDYFVKNFGTARETFLSSDFLKSPFMQNEVTRSIYDGLSRGTNKNIAIIEFFKAFEIDVSGYFTNIDEEISDKYVDETLDNIDISTLQRHKALDEYLSANGRIQNQYLINDEVLSEATSLIDDLRDRELLNVLASMCVRNNFVDEIAFKIYLKVIEKGSNIPGIYDKFLISIPNDYGYKLPLYIYRYYFDDKSYSFDDKSKLYENIIATFDEKEDVYSIYNDEILEYAISRIYQNRITESLVKIYDKVIDRNIVNDNNCNNVLYLLRNHKVVINDNNIKKVIIRYAQTEKETKYDVVNGIAYVPIFFDSYIMLYEDVYGNRLYSEDVRIQALFDKKDLEAYIIENYPQKDIIDMTKLIKLSDVDKFSKEYEIDETLELDSILKINPILRDKLRTKILDFYLYEVVNGRTLDEEKLTYLKQLPFNRLDLFDRRKLLKIFLESHEYKLVYEKVAFFGTALVEDADLLILYSKNIDINNEEMKGKLLNDIFAFVKKGNRDQKLCSYLANNYEGSIGNLYFVLQAAIEAKIDTSAIAKKLLMISLESNDTTYLDAAYENYDTRLDTDINLKMAYLNKKATDYILDEKETEPEYFEKLAKYMIDNIEKIDILPIVFLIAITKYISTFKILSNNDLRRILIKSMERLLKQEYVFAYFKKLNKHMQMPYYIMNKEYIEYHANKDFVPKAILTISGDDERREVELSKVFMNIYVKKITVFKNEVINYTIINSSDTSSGVLYSGTLKYDEEYEFEYPKTGKIRTTFDFINDAIVNLDRDNLEGLKKVVLEMKEKQEISKELFNI